MTHGPGPMLIGPICQSTEPSTTEICQLEVSSGSRHIHLELGGQG